MSIRIVGFLGLIAGLFSMSVVADVVVMKNGDRITGEIQEIWDKEILIEPAYDDDVKITIPLKEVTYVESDRDFEVIMSDGREVVAKFPGAGVDGSQLIEINGERTQIKLSEIEELDEVDDYYDFEAHADFNLALDKGNTDKLDTRFYTDIMYKAGDHRHIADLTLVREEQDSVTTKEEDKLRYSYNWFFEDPWYLGANIQAERDPVRELSHRYIAGLGLGRDIWDKPRRFLTMQGGLAYLTEEREPTDDQGNALPKVTNDSMAATWSLRFRHDFFGDDLEVFHNQTLLTYITGQSNTVVNTTTGTRYEITDLFYFNITLDYNWESEPAESADKEDLTLTAGIGVEF
ncbi:MAG: DUF481 domain-containing protein [Gammaproteobacteria bacterium]|nr:DUF481 domain-containing protein [Gammaproteobacteria bacterium]